MSVTAIVGGEKLQFELDDFDLKNSTFDLRDTSNRGIKLSVYFPLQVDKSFDNKEFLVFFLAKNELHENEIFQVWEARHDRRVGWCIPINALDSREHDFSTDIHFLKYAYVGIKTAFRTLNEEIFFKRPNVDVSDQVRLTDIFHESTALLVISKETLEEDFDIGRWLPALSTFGYFLLERVHSSQM